LATLDDIQFHYDVDNDFYMLFLDREFRAYSCGVWDGSITLEDAQRAKIDRICRFAHVTPASRVLDIGCGWGGLMERAISAHGAQLAHGLTLSNDQLTHIAQHGSPQVGAALESWLDHRPEQLYDAVTSVGAFEHFVSREERLAGRQIDIYRNFFATCRRLSTPHAWLGLQTIVAARNPATLQEARDARYLLDKVFPGSALPAESDIHASSAGSYEVAEIHRIGRDYARTLACWRERLLAQRRVASERFGHEVVEHYLRYFDAAERSFSSGVTDLVQASLRPVQTSQAAA
jgi:cyclopropane-fatty-acyl-phospholipid synthase